MPITFRETKSSLHQTSVAWLRFVDDVKSKSILAGLLESSVDGEPLGFSIAHVAVPESPTALQHIARQKLVSSLAKSLFQASVTSPVLLIGLKGEISSQGFDDCDLTLPLCCIDSKLLHYENFNSSKEFYRVKLLYSWITNPPSQGSEANRLFLEMLKLQAPFKPLRRIVNGIARAFADRPVNALNNVYGSTAVITLPPFKEHTRMRNFINASNTPDYSDALTDNEGNPIQPDLAAQMWKTLGAPKNDLIDISVNTNLVWNDNLMPFQRDGVGALVQMDRLLLSDDMGLGKTVQVIAAIRVLKSLRELDSCLVVTPASLLDQWRQEFVKWAPEISVIIIRGSVHDRIWQWKAKTEVTLISYDTLRSDARLVVAKNPDARIWDAVVLDEAQRIKNPTEISQITKEIPRLRSWALTGTPIENNEMDLASIMEFVDHNSNFELGHKIYYAGELLRRRHRDVQLRRKKFEVLPDLPPKLETKLTLRLHEDQQATYERAEREGIIYLTSLGTEVKVQHILELITRLKQICNFDPKTGVSSKLEDIRQRLTRLTAQGHKALIFSQYKSNTSGVNAIASRLREFNPLTLTGDVPPSQRTEIVNQFKHRDEHRVLVISLRVGGLGLNLQEASYVFHMDRWWNPAVERQAEDRAHRMGQTVKVNVIKYTCIETIEERIENILVSKQALFDELIDDVSINLSKSLTKVEMMSLFGLH